jgi:glucokinase
VAAALATSRTGLHVGGSTRHHLPPTPLHVPVIAVDLGGTKSAAALVTQEGRILARRRSLLRLRAGDEVAALIAEQCTALVADAGERGLETPTSVGVAVPGIYHAQNGTVWAPNVGGWDDYPLRDTLRRALGPAVRVVITNDRAACILGETWRGAAAGARDAIFLAVGTGIGAGIMVDGRVVRGHADIAGAIGWLALERPFDDRWTRCGDFEYHASGPGLATVARDLIERTPAYHGSLRGLDADDLTADRIFAAHETGDAIAERVIAQAVERWGMATANLVSLFNPQTIVFGGGVFGPALRFLDAIRDEARRWAQPIAMRQVTLVPSALRGDAAVYGVARLALDAGATV